MTDATSRNAIETSGLTRRFGSITAVDGVDLAIPQGQLFSVLGPNGAGKTTMIRMLCCLLAPSDGLATVAGHDLRTEANAIKQRINLSPQETAVAGHLTARENLLLIGKAYGCQSSESATRADSLLEQLGLTDAPKRQARRLSGGMQRRLSIAMALMSDPEILFLDEPTLGLDPQARRGLWEQIRALKGSKTILLTTHYLEEADALADRIAVLKDGRIIAEGSSSELKQNLIGRRTMLVRGSGFTEPAVSALRERFEQVTHSGDTVEIVAAELSFDFVVDTLRSGGGSIEWLTMREPTLDDVFLSLTEEEGSV